MTVIDPGLMFINSYGKIESAKDILVYAEFLRKESGQEGVVPVDLALVFQRFQIPTPIQKPLPGHRVC